MNRLSRNIALALSIAAGGGAAAAPAMPGGLVQLAIAGDSTVRSGVLVAPDLVMTSKRWLPAGINPGSIAVRQGTAPNGATHLGWAVNNNAQMPMGFIQIDGPFRTAPSLTYSLRSAAVLVRPRQNRRQSLDCFHFDNAMTATSTSVAMGRAISNSEVLSSIPGGLRSEHVGAPCFDSAGALAGFVLDTAVQGNNVLVTIFAIHDTKFFVDNMIHLATTRQAANLSTGFKIFTAVVGGAQMCLDAPGNPYSPAPVNVHPCHGGPNQRWLNERRVGNGTTLINVQTGTCLDVPGGSLARAEQLQMYDCHGGNNQVFIGQPPPQSLGPASSGDLHFCLSPLRVDGSTSPVIQDGCAPPGSPSQQWTFLP